MSFTYSGFLATTVVSTVFLQGDLFGEDKFKNWSMLLIAIVYGIIGLITSVAVYGRKTDHLYK